MEESKVLIGPIFIKFSGKPAHSATTFPVCVSTTNQSCCKEIQGVRDFSEVDCLDGKSGCPEETLSLPRRTWIRGHVKI